MLLALKATTRRVHSNYERGEVLVILAMRTSVPVAQAFSQLSETEDSHSQIKFLLQYLWNSTMHPCHQTKTTTEQCLPVRIGEYLVPHQGSRSINSIRKSATFQVPFLFISHCEPIRTICQHAHSLDASNSTNHTSCNCRTMLCETPTLWLSIKLQSCLI